MRVVDSELLKEAQYITGEPDGSLYNFHDINGKALQFPEGSTTRPAKRCFAFHARVIKQLNWPNWPLKALEVPHIAWSSDPPTAAFPRVGLAALADEFFADELRNLCEAGVDLDEACASTRQALAAGQDLVVGPPPFDGSSNVDCSVIHSSTSGTESLQS